MHNTRAIEGLHLPPDQTLINVVIPKDFKRLDLLVEWKNTTRLSLYDFDRVTAQVRLLATPPISELILDLSSDAETYFLTAKGIYRVLQLGCVKTCCLWKPSTRICKSGMSSFCWNMPGKV